MTSLSSPSELAKKVYPPCFARGSTREEMMEAAIRARDAEIVRMIKLAKQGASIVETQTWIEGFWRACDKIIAAIQESGKEEK
jgi:hypothetical protein